MDIGILAPQDRRILHALVETPRASITDLARVSELSVHSVRRRLRELEASYGLRVTARVVEDNLGWDRWIIRLRSGPAATEAIASALAARPDTRWVRSVSGGTEVICGMQTRPNTPDALAQLVGDIPLIGRSRDVDAVLVLADFSNSEQADEPVSAKALTPSSPVIGPSLRGVAPLAGVPTTRWTKDDERLLGELQRDGRASAAQLAIATGWHETTVRRRVAQLTNAHALAFDIDLNEHSLGLTVTAQLWITVDTDAVTPTARTVARHAEVDFVAATTGHANLFASVSCPTVDQLYGYLTTRLGALAGVRHIHTAPTSRTYKRSAALTRGLL